MKGSTVSTIAQWDHFHTDIIYEFSKLFQIWGYVCIGNGVSVLPYAHPQLLRCSNTSYMYDIDIGCSLKGSTASVIVQWDHFHTDII